MLLFIDNIFRFVQAGSVSALMGRMHAAVGYQPLWPTKLGALQVSPPPPGAPSPRCRLSTSPPTT